MGIFSTIVLGFVGTITFSASVLENINKVEPYRLLSISCIIALIFINFLWLLTSFLLHITDRKITLLTPVGVFANILFVTLLIFFMCFYSDNKTSTTEDEKASLEIHSTVTVKEETPQTIKIYTATH